MDIMEIILLIAGGVVFTASFFIPDKKAAEVDVKELSEDEIRAVISREVASAKSRIEDLTEKTERTLEKLSNEKILAVEEYSDTVLAQIHKNHEEAVFLYDMLNNKHTSLKSSLGEVSRTVKEAREAAAAFGKQNPKEEVKPAAAQEPEAEKNRGIKKASAPEVSGPALPEAGIHKGLLSMKDGEEESHNNNDKILVLYRQGKSATAIAKELGLGVGEVKLVIGLFQN